MIHPIIIVGAGLSGLMAQSVLKQNSIDSMIIEKSQGLGGRCATRRGLDFIADHGPQYFNSRILNSGFIRPDSVASLRKLDLDLETNHPRLIHPRGMSQIARMVAGDPTVITRERVIVINRIQDHGATSPYEITCESGRIFQAKNLILTAPIPQSLAILKNLPTSLTQTQTIQELATIDYDPCIALILELTDTIHLGNDGIWKNCSDQISGIYNQPEKGLETETPCLVIHASPKMSLQIWNEESAETEKLVLAEANKCLREKKIDLNIKKIHLHRWKYAEPRKLYPKAYAFLGTPGNECALAGDGFLRSSIGGALNSGDAAARAMIQQGI